MSGIYIQYPNSSGGVATYPTLGDFPATASPGALAVALDTDTLYIYDDTTGMWLAVGGTAVPLVVGTYDSATPSANGAVIGSNSLFMQSASASVPGLVNAGTQTFAGTKSFSSAPRVPGVVFVGSASGQVLTQAAQTSSSIYTLTWPAVQGAANSFPQNDGNGNLTWVPISVSSGSSVQLTMAPLDGAAKSPQGAVIGSNTLFMQTADTVFPGVVSSAAQSFSGLKTFVSAPQFSSLSSNLPAVLGSGSILSSRSLLFGSPDVIGSVSLSTQVSGLLPITQTLGSVSLTDKVSGILPATNMPPLSGLTGSVSLTTQVSGVLPAANIPPLSGLTGSVSLETQVSGLLPFTQTSGSVSLLNQVREYFPTVTIGSISHSQVAGGALYPINWPSVQGGSGTVPQNDGSGNLTWSSPSAGSTLSSVTFVTANYQSQPGNETIICNSSGFTVTLLAGVSGQQKEIKYNQATFSGIVVIGSMSGSTGSVVGSTTLNTTGESISITYNGTAWEITNRRIPGGWSQYSPAIVGFGTVSSSFFSWRRSGPNIQISGYFAAGTPTAVQARIPFPGSLVAASEVGPLAPQAQSAGVVWNSFNSANIGTLLRQTGASYFTMGVQGAGFSGLSPRNGDGILGVGDAVSFLGEAPIAGWNG